MTVIKNYRACIFSVCIVTIFIISFVGLHHIMPFGSNSIVTSDGYHQIYPLLVELHNKLQNGDSIYYSWSSAYGGEFLSTYLYFISNPIYLLVGIINVDHIMSFLMATMFMRIVFCAFSFSLYVKKVHKVDDLFIVAVSVSYALSGFICGFYFVPEWLDAYMLFPLIMLGFKRVKDEESPLLYVLSLSFCAYLSYYITFIIAIFLVISFLLDDYSSIKDFLKKGLFFAGYSLLSVGIAFFPLYISYNKIRQNAYLKVDSIPNHYFFGNIFEVIRYLFFLSKPIGSSYTLNSANIYCGVLIIFLSVFFFVSKDIGIAKKIKKFVFLFLLFFSMNESLFNYAFHGFHSPNGLPNRFSFLAIFLLLDIACVSYCEVNETNTKRIVIASIIVEFLPMISYFFVDYDSFVVGYQVLIINLILFLVYSISVIIKSLKLKYSGVVSILISVIMILEILFGALISFSHHVGIFDESEKTIKEYRLIQSDINENEPDVFRSDALNEGELNLNLSTLIGAKGVYGFNHMISFGVTSAISQFGGCTTLVSLYSQDYPPFLESISGLKYVFVEKNQDIYSERENYELTSNTDLINVYQNKYALSFGFAVDKDIQKFEYINSARVNNLNNLSECMCGIGDIYNDTFPQYSITSNNTLIKNSDMYCDYAIEKLVDNNVAYLEFEIENSGEYYLDFSTSFFTNVTIEINDFMISQSNSVSGGMSYLGKLEQGDRVKVQILRNESGHINGEVEQDGFAFRIVMQDSDCLMNAYNKLSMNQMSINEFSNTKFSGNIDIEDGQMLFLSIPYDECWHVYENGKELKTEKLLGCFTGIELSEGTHNLDFEYKPKGVLVGGLISCLSILAFILVLVFRNKKRKIKIESIEDCSLS